MCVGIFPPKLTNLSWIRRNTNMNFVIQFSVMDITEIEMRRFVYISFIFIKGNVLRGECA